MRITAWDLNSSQDAIGIKHTYGLRYHVLGANL